MAATQSAFADGPHGALAPVAEVVTTGIETAGVGIIVLAALIATGLFLREGIGGAGWAPAYERYRANLGRGILLGLELLVAADIVGTVAAPMDLRTIGVLGIIVLIRTFLSFSLEVEIKGHWPWQDSRFRRPRGGGERRFAPRPQDGGALPYTADKDTGGGTT